MAITAFPIATSTIAAAAGEIVLAIDANLGSTVWQSGSAAETVTTLAYAPLTKTLTYTDELGAAVAIDLSGLAIDMNVSGGSFVTATGVLTLTGDDGMPDVVINLGDLKSVTSQLSITGDGNTTALSLVGDVALPGNGFYYGTDGAGAKGWNVLPAGVSPATVVSPAANDLVGLVGAAILYAREDHKHPAQSVSTDATNNLDNGTDGRAFFTLDAATLGVPLVGNFVLGWSNGTLTVFPI